MAGEKTPREAYTTIADVKKGCFVGKVENLIRNEKL
jgi:hypothetical protein